MPHALLTPHLQPPAVQLSAAGPQVTQATPFRPQVTSDEVSHTLP
jgi:hypothetical protein